MSDIEKEVIRLLSESIDKVNNSVTEVGKDVKKMNTLLTSTVEIVKQHNEAIKEIHCATADCDGKKAWRAYQTDEKVKEQKESLPSRIGTQILTACAMAPFVAGLVYLAEVLFKYYSK